MSLATTTASLPEAAFRALYASGDDGELTEGSFTHDGVTMVCKWDKRSGRRSGVR